MKITVYVNVLISQLCLYSFILEMFVNSPLTYVELAFMTKNNNCWRSNMNSFLFYRKGTNLTEQ